MTTSRGKLITIRLACDSCGAARQGLLGQRIDDLRLKLKAVGWACSSAQDIDICPTCRTGACLPLATETRLVR